MSMANIYRQQVDALKIEQKRTKAASLDASRRAVDAYIAQADVGRYSRRKGQRFESLKAVAEATRLLDSLEPGDFEITRRESLRDLTIAALALPDIRTAKTFGQNPGNSCFLDIDAEFKRYVVSDPNGNCVMYRTDDGSEVFRFPNTGPNSICTPMIAPQGRFLAVLFWMADFSSGESKARSPFGLPVSRSALLNRIP